MTKSPVALLLGLLLALTMLGTAQATASGAGDGAVDRGAAGAERADAPARRDVTFYQLGYDPGIKRPKRVFTTASSGPYFKQLQWRGWGTDHARGRGILDNSCASCGGPAKSYRAVLHFRGFRACGDGITVYRRAYATFRHPDGSPRRTSETVVCPNGA